ncbi:MAG: hypothetical protein K8H88_17705 [Sandaracinaceae bacterium]|nr:hypothetical protein [Sandaracinaceae bacterium]
MSAAIALPHPIAARPSTAEQLRAFLATGPSPEQLETGAAHLERHGWVQTGTQLRTLAQHGRERRQRLVTQTPTSAPNAPPALTAQSEASVSFGSSITAADWASAMGATTRSLVDGIPFDAYRGQLARESVDDARTTSDLHARQCARTDQAETLELEQRALEVEKLRVSVIDARARAVHDARQRDWQYWAQRHDWAQALRLREAELGLSMQRAESQRRASDLRAGLAVAGMLGGGLVWALLKR